VGVGYKEQPQPDIAGSHSHRGRGRGSLLVSHFDFDFYVIGNAIAMIAASHPLHTHIRSSSYIYNAIQHLLHWLQVIRMLPHPYLPSGTESGCCWYRRWVSVRSYD
jgi:hypothetical protein